MNDTIDETISPPLLQRFVGKKCEIQLLSGRTVIAVLLGYRKYELLVSEGGWEKVINKHAIASVSFRRDM